MHIIRSTLETYDCLRYTQISSPCFVIFIFVAKKYAHPISLSLPIFASLSVTASSQREPSADVLLCGRSQMPSVTDQTPVTRSDWLQLGVREGAELACWALRCGALASYHPAAQQGHHSPMLISTVPRHTKTHTHPTEHLTKYKCHMKARHTIGKHFTLPLCALLMKSIAGCTVHTAVFIQKKDVFQNNFIKMQFPCTVKSYINST